LNFNTNGITNVINKKIYTKKKADPDRLEKVLAAAKPVQNYRNQYHLFCNFPWYKLVDYDFRKVISYLSVSLNLVAYLYTLCEKGSFS